MSSLLHIASLAFFTAGAVLAQDNAATPTPTFSLASPTNSACATASSAIAASQFQDNRIDAEIAYKCLTSIPVDPDADAKLMDELKVIMEWYSEVSWLKHPPAHWDLGPLDMIAEFDKVKARIQSNSYSNEYELQLDILSIFTRTGNFHINWSSDLLSIFSFNVGINMVSLSPDGKQNPLIYAVRNITDIQTIKDNGKKSTYPSVTHINGQDVQAYLDDDSNRQQYINADARFNSLMYKSDEETGSFDGFVIYSGPTTSFTFSNGKTVAQKNYAIPSSKNIRSFLEFVGHPLPASSSGSKVRRGEVATKPIHAHERRGLIPTSGPTPVASQEARMVAGYFMTTPGFEDTAVLKIPTFDTSGAAQSPGGTDKALTDFQSTITEFLDACKKNNKKRLLIDLRENGGGDVSLLLDAFMQLFPSETPFSAQRYRANEGFEIVGNALNEIYESPTFTASVLQQANVSGMWYLETLASSDHLSAHH
jgi:hypothetical protein